MTPSGSNEISRLRASDADRDKAASVINQALADGRLTAEEHSERLDAIYRAKTHADLAPLLSDLPAVRHGAGSQPVSAAGQGEAAEHGAIVAVFGGASRKGAWRVPRTSTVVTVFGGADLDLREAILPGREATIRTICVFGGMEITVPPDMHVVDSGFAVFGGRDISGDSPESASPEAPVLRLTGACVFGGIGVKRKQRKQGAESSSFRTDTGWFLHSCHASRQRRCGSAHLRGDLRGGRG
jgi:hypothetical protein